MEQPSELNTYRETRERGQNVIENTLEVKSSYLIKEPSSSQKTNNSIWIKPNTNEIYSKAAVTGHIPLSLSRERKEHGPKAWCQKIMKIKKERKPAIFLFYLFFFLLISMPLWRVLSSALARREERRGKRQRQLKGLVNTLERKEIYISYCGKNKKTQKQWKGTVAGGTSMKVWEQTMTKHEIGWKLCVLQS